MGVVRARDFKHLLDEELLEELKDQKVSKIHRVTRMMNEKKIKVLPYVEEPMRCFKCLKFGHQKMRCNFAKEPVCGRCARPQHVDRQKNEKCTGDSYCVNCESDEHGSFDKRCMVYKKEFKIAKIKNDERVTFGEAHKIYVQRVVQGGETLAGIIKNVVESRERKSCESDVDMKEEESGKFKISLEMTPEEEEVMRQRIAKELEDTEIEGDLQGGTDGRMKKKKRKKKTKKKLKENGTYNQIV